MLKILIVHDSKIIKKESRTYKIKMDNEIEYFQYLHSNPALAESTDLYHEVLSCLESNASSAVADIQESLEDTDRIISCI